jgi:hypothetical protein
MLSAAVGTWSNTPGSFAYQWERCDPTGASCTAIAGATGESYTVTPTDSGSTLVAVVTATNTYGTATATTVATPVISQ